LTPLIHAAKSLTLSLVCDHLAIVPQRARRPAYGAAELRNRTQRCRNLDLQRAGRAVPSSCSVIASVSSARDAEAQSPEFGLALDDLGDLLGTDEPTLDLGGLVGEVIDLVRSF